MMVAVGMMVLAVGMGLTGMLLAVGMMLITGGSSCRWRQILAVEAARHQHLPATKDMFCIAVIAETFLAGKFKHMGTEQHVSVSVSPLQGPLPNQGSTIHVEDTLTLCLNTMPTQDIPTSRRTRRRGPTTIAVQARTWSTTMTRLV
jgi:hypothetical protein